MEETHFNLYEIVLGKTGSKYIVVAKSEVLDVAIRISPTYVTFHVYRHEIMQETLQDNVKKYLTKLGFVENAKYWSGRFVVNNKLNKLIVIGGILYALTDIVTWITPWPDPILLFSNV